MKLPEYIGKVQINSAVISKVTKRGIYVIPPISCDKPAGCHGCSLCTPSNTKTQRFCSVTQPNDYTETQSVTIQYFSFNEATASLVAFGVPILCALITYLMTGLLIETSQESPVRVLLTAGSLVFGFVLVYLIDKMVSWVYPVRIINAD